MIRLPLRRVKAIQYEKGITGDLSLSISNWIGMVADLSGEDSSQDRSPGKKAIALAEKIFERRGTCRPPITYGAVGEFTD